MDLSDLRRDYGRILGRQTNRPPCRGGYRFTCDRIEFWQGGQYRLYHRMAYYQEKESRTKEKYAP